MGSHQPTDTFIFSASDDHQVFCRRWLVPAPRAVVQLVHGGAEHCGRYQPLAERLNAAGLAVYAEDHRGHGRTGEINTRLGDMGTANAFERVCNDVLALGRRASVEHQGLPLIIIGHSLGSLIAQRILLRPDQPYSAAVLSGSPDILQVAQGADLVHAEVTRVGREQASETLEAVIVEGFAAAFPDEESPHAWLSRDRDQLALYAQDPLCGFPLSTGAWQDLISAMIVTTELPALAAGLRKDLPIYIVSGTADPVHNNWSAIERLSDNYRSCGLGDVTVTAYPGGRHEMFNEINRDQVVAEMISWLESKIQ